MPDIGDITFISTHFSDFGWIEFLVKQIIKTTPSFAVHEILIVDQDRSVASRERLQNMPAAVRVFQYPQSDPHFKITGHDHAAVLNKILPEAKGKYICIFDSDAHPISSSWLNKCGDLMQSYDAVVAQDHRKPDFSHPCFMLIKNEHIGLQLKFDDMLFSKDEIDTGRLIAHQLRNAGQKVYVAPPRRAFAGKWGQIYLDSIYHHGQGSFTGGGERLKSQLTWRHLFFRNIVLHHHKYSLNIFQQCKYLCYSLSERMKYFFK